MENSSDANNGLNGKNLTTITVVGLICLMFIEIAALQLGIDGAMLGGVTAIFGSIIGAVAVKIKGNK